jgi:hypothetical protein
MVTVRRHLAVVLSVSAGVAAASVLGWPAAGLAATARKGGGPATLVAPGVAVQFTGLPGQFVSGGDPSRVIAVASSSADTGRRCERVRWTMLLRSDGVALNTVRVGRVENNALFPVQVRIDGDAARITDQDFDPGQLCRDRTVTAQYEIAVSDPASTGQLSLQVAAFDRNQQLLQQTDAATDPGAAGPSAQPTAPDPAVSQPSLGLSAASRGGGTSMLGVGLIVGTVLIFLGVGLLLRLRLKGRRRQRDLGPAYPMM